MEEVRFRQADTENCMFCDRIRAGETHDFIEETDLTIARVNGRQFEEGQSVIIPRRHASTLFDLSDEEADAVMRASRRLGRAIVKAFDAAGLLFYQNNGRVSGQTVPHYHLHVVPQHEDTSPWGNGPRHIAQLEAKEFVGGRPAVLTERQSGEVAARIRAHL